MKPLLKKQSVVVVLLLVAILMVPTVAGANPLDKIDGVDGSGVNEDQIFEDLNTVLTLIYFIAGFVSLVALIVASILLATSASNPQRRSGGFVALGMAILGGWVLFKAFDIAAWLGSFG